MAVGVWNFVGAGIFGFLINLPIVSYFEVGTTLTPNHGHAALFGVFGMLALAVLVFCLRAMQSDATWKETQKFVRVGFWGANVGLALMIILDLFPGGVIQLWDSVANGYLAIRILAANSIMPRSLGALDCLENIPPAGVWRESFWVAPSGF